MAKHANTPVSIAWRLLWTEEPGRPQHVRGKESDMSEQLPQPQQPTIVITEILPIDFLLIFTYIWEKEKSVS